MDVKSELARERAVLVKSDHDLAQGEMRIAGQQALVRDLRASGDNTCEAERLLQLLRDTLAQWQGHRVLILDRISYLANKLEEGKPGPDFPDRRARRP
jgi:hypothetical protein